MLLWISAIDERFRDMVLLVGSFFTEENFNLPPFFLVVCNHIWCRSRNGPKHKTSTTQRKELWIHTRFVWWSSSIFRFYQFRLQCAYLFKFLFLSLKFRYLWKAWFFLHLIVSSNFISQTCSPPILPPLKEIYEGNVADALTGNVLVDSFHGLCYTTCKPAWFCL